MAGLRGFSREPRAPARARRNSQSLASEVTFVQAGEIIALTDEGFLTANLATDGGLANTAGELGIQLDTNPGLALSAGGLTVVLADTSLQLGASGLSVLLNTNSGLSVSGGGLTIVLDGATLALGASGLSVQTGNLTAATTGTRGVVNQAAAVADLGLTVTDPPTQVETQAISDKVDELMGSLRTAGLLAT